VSYDVKCGFSGLLVAAEPGKIRTIAQKIRCLRLSMLCCVVVEEFGAQAFLKSTSTDFGGRRVWFREVLECILELLAS
jgi:hypothetical protein